MSNGENGKNGKEKEIDRLLRLIDSVARIDTKVTSIDEQTKEQIGDIKQRITEICNQLLDLEKRRSDLVQQVERNEASIIKMREGIARWKIYWSAIAFIVVPLFTYLITKAFNILLHIPI